MSLEVCKRVVYKQTVHWRVSGTIADLFLRKRFHLRSIGIFVSYFVEVNFLRGFGHQR